MDNRPESHTTLLLEQHLERQALDVCRSATFVQCLKGYDLAPSIAVSTPRGKTLSISASSIWGARKRFFARHDLETAAYSLSVLGERMAELYAGWLLNEATERYRFLTSSEHREWLRKVVVLVVARHLMEQKYASFLAEGKQVFADPWVCGEMGRLSLLHQLPGLLAQLVHHIVKERGEADALLDCFHKDIEERLKECSLVLPEQLPALPRDTRLPLIFLAQGKESSSA